MIMENIGSLSIFDLAELWTRFQTFDGLTKIVCTFLLSSYLILSNIVSVTVTLYGNYLLERFKLEEKYPKLGIFIK